MGCGHQPWVRVSPQEKLCVWSGNFKEKLSKDCSADNFLKMDNLLPCMHLTLSFMAWFLWLACFISFLLMPKEVVTLCIDSISKMWLKQATLIITETILHPVLFGWAQSWWRWTFSKWQLGMFLIFKILNKVKLIPNKEALEISLVHLLA